MAARKRYSRPKCSRNGSGRLLLLTSALPDTALASGRKALAGKSAVDVKPRAARRVGENPCAIYQAFLYTGRRGGREFVERPKIGQGGAQDLWAGQTGIGAARGARPAPCERPLVITELTYRRISVRFDASLPSKTLPGLLAIEHSTRRRARETHPRNHARLRLRGKKTTEID